MSYVIGFAIGCIFTEIIMCRFAGKSAAGVMDKINEELLNRVKYYQSKEEI